MPASRAASALPPTANVRRPKVVRLSSTQPATATRAKTMTSVGMPSTSPEKNRMKLWSCTIWVRRSEMISASPRAAASMARVAMKAASLP
jgi:hypothetical protein